MKNALLGILGFVALAALGAIAFVYSGLYPIGATSQHARVVYDAIDVLVRRSVAQSADRVVAPAGLGDEALVRDGLGLYRGWCAQCHGAPGVAPEPFATGMNPTPPPLVQTARTWSPAEIWWVLDNGIAMAGMPAFRFKLTDDEMWAIAAFVSTLPELSPAGYAALVEEIEAEADVAARADGEGGT